MRSVPGEAWVEEQKGENQIEVKEEGKENRKRVRAFYYSLLLFYIIDIILDKKRSSLERVDRAGVI